MSTLIKLLVGQRFHTSRAKSPSRSVLTRLVPTIIILALHVLSSMVVQFYNAQVLFVGGAVAFDPRCCCPPGSGSGSGSGSGAGIITACCPNNIPTILHG